MSTQPQAILLARELDAYPTAWHHKQAAAELRRLHAENERLAALVAEYQQTLALQQRSYEREIQLEVEAEREECAKVCEDYDDDRGTGETWGPRFAALIRARTT